MNSILNALEKVFDSVRSPFSSIPGMLLALGTIKRPGLSPMLIASNIIRRQSEAGAPVGPAPDGTENTAELMERIRVEEIINAIQMDSKVQVSFPIGAIQVQTTGANSGGPMTSLGFNINMPQGVGVIC